MSEKNLKPTERGTNLSLRNGLIGILAIALALTMAACGGNGATDRSIIVGETVWNYDVITTGVLERALEAEGWTVTKQEIFDLGPAFAGIAANDINLYPGYWLPTLHASWRQQYQDEIRSIGNIYGEPTPVGLTIPTYMAEDLNIASIGDLQGHAGAFDSRIVGYEPGTGGSEAAELAIQEYNLEGFQFLPSSVPAMLAELDSAISRNEGVVIVGYRPSPMFAQHPIVMLDDPMDAFGVDSVSFAVNASYADEHPELARFLENFVIPLDEMEAMLIDNEEHGVPENDLAEQWYNDNQATIASWWD